AGGGTMSRSGVRRGAGAAAALACAAALGCGAAADGAAQRPGADTPQAAGSGPVRPGVAVLLRDSLAVVRGRRVGLITNQTGVVTVDAGGRDTVVSTADLLHARDDLELVALYSPEHGLAGQ